MSLYAKPGKVLAKQILWDLATIGWIVLWVFLAIAVRRLVELFAAPAQKAADLATSLSGEMTNAANSVDGVPLVGDKLRVPFDSMSSGLVSIVGYANSIVHLVQVTALVLAIIVGVVPIVIWLWKWLPGRVSWVYQSVHARRLTRAKDSVELFALRAMANAPMSAISRVTTDPMGAWRRGDTEVLRKLAVMELGRDGLALPRRRNAVGVRFHQPPEDSDGNEQSW